MKKYSWILVVAAVAPLFPLACGGGGTTSTSTGSGGGSGGGTTTGNMTTTTGGPTTTTTGGMTTTSATTGGTGGGTADCSGILNPNDCATCLEGGCCNELAACSDQACIGCATGDDTMCDASNQAMADALTACKDATCDTECNTTAPPSDATCTVPTPSPSLGACVTLSATIKCNPVTNAPCNTAAGEACDFNTDGYECYPAPNDKDLCQACGSQDGFCKGGETCAGVCAKFCCDDGDCGAGKCDKTAMSPGGVGICIGGNGGTTSSTAASSSSTGP